MKTLTLRSRRVFEIRLCITVLGIWLKLLRTLMESIQSMVKAVSAQSFSLLLLDTGHNTHLCHVNVSVCMKGNVLE